MRDISERGRDLEQVLTQYMTFVKPAFEEFCLPVWIFVGFNNNNQINYPNYLNVQISLFQTKKFSDVIIPRGADNSGL